MPRGTRPCPRRFERDERAWRPVNHEVSHGQASRSRWSAKGRGPVSDRAEGYFGDGANSRSTLRRYPLSYPSMLSVAGLQAGSSLGFAPFFQVQTLSTHILRARCRS